MAALSYPMCRSFKSFLQQSFRLPLADVQLCRSKHRTYAAAKPEKIQITRKKKRLDEVCLEQYHQYSRTLIQSWILQGKVFVNGKLVNKAGAPTSDKAVVEIKAEIPKYVCRAGYKLEAAIEKLTIDVKNKVALDSGLSTGGFTDCLLQHGASFVYGVDVGYGQVADKIRLDERVSVIERTNLRYLSELPQQVDLVTLDLSFISILTVMPAVIKLMKGDSTLVTLVKPQFEARRSQVGGGGIVRNPLVHQEKLQALICKSKAVHRIFDLSIQTNPFSNSLASKVKIMQVLEKIINGVEALGFCSKGWIESPIKGAEGNTEFLVCFQRIPQNPTEQSKNNNSENKDNAFD